MKKIRFFALITLFFALKSIVFAQWQNEGAYVTISAGTYVRTNIDVSIESGTIRNNGTVTVRSLDIKTAGTLRGSGNWFITRDLINNGSIIANLTYNFINAAPSTIFSDGDPLYDVRLTKTGTDRVVTLVSPLTVTNKMWFVGSSNKLVLGNHDLTLTNTCEVLAASSSKYFITNGTGKVIKQGVGATQYTFPIGANSTTYNPISVINSGASDNIGVRVLTNALASGSTGAALTSDAVAASWEISEGTAGGSNLTLSTFWRTADELSGFNRANCAVRRWTGSTWDSSPLGAATGAGTATNPYTRSRTGLTSLGYFAVLDDAFLFANQQQTMAKEAITERDILEEMDLHLYPNPTQSSLYISKNEEKIMEDCRLVMLDASGKQISEYQIGDWKAQTPIEINISQLPEGLYWLRVLAKSENPRVLKFVVERD